MRAKEGHVPKNILRFERLMYASLAVALVDFTPASTTLIASDFRDILLGLTIIGAGFGIYATMIWLAARRRKNWARWVLLGLFVVDLSTTLPALVHVAGGFALARQLLRQTCQGGALYFAFTGDAMPWFAPPPSSLAASAAAQHVSTAFLVVLSVIAGAACLVLPVFVLVGGMACDYKCNLPTPLTIGLAPLALAAGVIAGWSRRRRDGPAKVLLWTLAPIVLDVALFAVSVVLPEL